MDPFSFATGAIGVVDVCLRLGKFLRDVAKTAKQIQIEITALDYEISNFRNVYDALRKLRPTEGQQTPLSRQYSQDPCERLWARAAEVTNEAQELIEELDGHLAKVIGEKEQSTVEDVKKAVRLFQKHDNFRDIKVKLAKLNMELNTMLTAINTVSMINFRLEVFQSIDQLPQKISEELQFSVLDLKAHINSLETSSDLSTKSISAANEAINFASLNQHFHVKAVDIKMWTGRNKNLEQLKMALFPSTAFSFPRQQRRFVIHGIAGAGKTQFCSKFAQDYRESFWGIFWIDATSPQSATESWKHVAELGGKDPNEEAGKYWLSNHQLPWLLIIDSANDSEDSIRSNFPSGDRGVIIITTRNPRLVATATVGEMSLDRLEENEAKDLLRKTTYHKPWDDSATAHASSIARRLGYLPLALVHAGKAIMHKFCTLPGYIPFFNQSLHRFRQDRASLVVEAKTLGQSALESFEVIYGGLEKEAAKKDASATSYLDALELINIFSCFHCNDIRLETFIRAGCITKKETENAARPTASKGPLQRFIEWAAQLQQHNPVLPRIFDSVKDSHLEDVQPSNVDGDQILDENQAPTFARRIRMAIDRLVMLAMISESSEPGSYSMHPLVHDWVRERLSMAEQALWCQCAVNILAHSVKLPPFVDEQEDRIYYLRVLSHVEHVRTLQEKIAYNIQRQRNWGDQHIMTRLRYALTPFLWIRQPAAFTRVDARNCAKYGRIYMECGKFEDAEGLQLLVRDFLFAMLGPNHPLSILIQMALAVSLHHQGRSAESLKLQKSALRASQITLGDDDPQTLRILDALGDTSYQTGQLREAKGYHEAAIKGMEGKPGMERDLFKAINRLGHVYGKYFAFDDAQKHHEKALSGLKDAFGEDDLDTITAMDSLAMSLLDTGKLEEAIRARALMETVYPARLAKLKEEHIFTLWAKGNLARTIARQGELERKPELIIEAKQLLTEAVDVATRNLGENHIGPLFGRMWLAHFLVLERNYQEAESEFLIVIEKQGKLPSARKGTHPDRVGAMWMLARCYEIQDRYQDGAELCDKIVEELGRIGGQDHPLARNSARKRDQLLMQVNSLTHEQSPPLWTDQVA